MMYFVPDRYPFKDQSYFLLFEYNGKQFLLVLFIHFMRIIFSLELCDLSFQALSPGKERRFNSFSGYRCSYSSYQYLRSIMLL